MRREVIVTKSNRSVLPQRVLPALLACGLLLALAGAARAEAVDWNAMADADTVTIVTTNEDGTPRETTIWLLVMDGKPYVRTGSTRWGANAERSPDVKLRVGEREFSLTAVPVTDPALAEKLQQGFRAKYGWSDRMVGLMPGAGTRLFLLEPAAGS
jgi:hypothetical protein